MCSKSTRLLVHDDLPLAPAGIPSGPLVVDVARLVLLVSLDLLFES